MHLLRRRISPCTAPDQCLGVFRFVHEADYARNEYISSIKNGIITDPFAKQAYYTVDLEADLQVVSDVLVSNVDANSDEVFVVSSLDEAFGQILRTFEAICGSKEQAELVMSSIDESESQFACSGHIQLIRIGQLCFETVN